MFNKFTVCSCSTTAVNFFIIIAIIVIAVFVVIKFINLNELWSSLSNFSKLFGDWGWLVVDQILKLLLMHGTAKHILFATILGSEDELLSHRDGGVLDEVNETFLGDILTIKNSNLGSC